MSSLLFRCGACHLYFTLGIYPDIKPKEVVCPKCHSGVMTSLESGSPAAELHVEPSDRRFRAACAAMQGMLSQERRSGEGRAIGGTDFGPWRVANGVDVATRFANVAHHAVSHADALLARLRETEGGAS